MLSTLHHWQEFKKKGEKWTAKFFPCFDGLYQNIDAHAASLNYTLELPNSPNTYPTYHASELKPFLPNDASLSFLRTTSTWTSPLSWWAWRISCRQNYWLLKMWKRSSVPHSLIWLWSQTQPMAFQLCAHWLQSTQCLAGMVRCSHSVAFSHWVF